MALEKRELMATSLGKRTKLVLTEVKRGGEVYFDLRKHYLTDDDTWIPTKKGIHVLRDKFEHFFELYNRFKEDL